MPYFLSLLAEGYARLGQVEAGLAVLQEGWEVMERTGEHTHRAEMSRLKGALLLNDERGMMNDERGTSLLHVDEAEACFQQQFKVQGSTFKVQAEAETCFQHAIAVAQQQSAKSLELRASVSLARLWHQQGKTTEARDLLAPVYDWFTEGFDTADLKDAKALLEELS